MFLSNPIKFKRIDIVFFLLAISIVLVYVYFYLNTFNGDATIYLVFAKNIHNGHGLAFNPHEFSSGATSPLWAFILSVVFLTSSPEIFAQILGLLFLVAGLIAGYVIMPKNYVANIGLALILSLALIPSLMFFETGLLVLVSFLMFKYDYAIGILPFVRPEGFIISAMLGIRKPKRLLWLIPIVLFWAFCIYKTGYFSTSAVFRSMAIQDFPVLLVYLIKRYLVVIMPFIVYWGSILYEIHTAFDSIDFAD